MVQLDAVKGLLTAARLFCKLNFPKNDRGITIAFLSAPWAKKVLSAVFAIPLYWREHIGMAATSGTREGPAVSIGPGSVVCHALFLIPKTIGGCYA